MAGLQFFNNGLLTFTDGTYLHLGCRIITNDEFSGPTHLYKKYTGGYNPQTGEFAGDELPIMACIRDTTNNTKIAGFNGEKIDSNGNKWVFGLNSLVVKDENDNIIFSQSIRDYHNCYTVGYVNNQLVLIAGVLPHYEDSRYTKEFYGLNGIADGGSAGTVFNDYFKDEATFFSFDAPEGLFENYNQSDKNDFAKSPVVIACQLNGYALAPSQTTYPWSSEMWAITGANLPEPVVDPDDPYQPGGTTTPGGGQGSFDRSSDPIDVPGMPSLSAIDTGFVSLWRPSTTELINLHNYMWSNAFDLESFKKIFANPIDAIMGFGIIPLNPVTGAERTLKIGNIDTGVNVTPITEQYYQVDCGTLYLDNYFDTYLEFEPYSTLEIFLPFCGCMQLSADDFYRRKKEYPGGGKINVKYNVDILSGSCVAFISCYDANGATTMTYEFSGNLLTQIPITGNDFSGLYNAVLGIAGNVVSGVAHAATGNAAGILGDVVNAAHNVTSAKPSINRSGTIGGSYGLLANRKPFLIRNIPREAAAWAQNTFQGYPSHITTAIKSINGYTEFEKVYTDNIPASDNELKEIVQILETGVIL